VHLPPVPGPVRELGRVAQTLRAQEFERAVQYMPALHRHPELKGHLAPRGALPAAEPWAV
jgi:hypothetical protein